MQLKLLLLLATLGHIICFICDCWITYTPDGQFNFSIMKDNQKMGVLFKNMSVRNAVLSMMVGLVATIMMSFGYLELSDYVKEYSTVYGTIMYIACCILFPAMAVHHVTCGALEWFYVKFDRTQQALDNIVEFFKKTALSMYLGAGGLVVFAVTLFIAVVSGTIDALPRWACVFNILVLSLAILPTKLPGKANLAGTVMYLGLFFLV